ncbi:MAG TPA: hypothetical protein VM370_01840 [Candidatus Thermoplasmatota archaeon]|nr:hypothetical protein [Candidatus Thermoplasmatota archaeon]
MPEPSTWTYVDARRTHEVRVARELGRTNDLVIREQLFGGGPPDEMYVERHTLAEPWEEKLHILALETRLALLGNYYKHSAAGWIPVRLAQPAKLDLAPLEAEDPLNTIEFHHFNGQDRHAVSLVGVHQETERGRRSLLLRLDYEFPATDGGNLQIVHSKLPPILYRSALASLHLELSELRFKKTPSDARKLADPRTWAALRAALDAILARIMEEASDKVEGLRDGMGRPLDPRGLVAVNAAVRAAKGAASAERQYGVDFEVEEAAAAARGKAPEVMFEALSPDVFEALREPKLLALHTRFMPPDAEKALFERGERAIQIAMRDKRASVRPDEQHLVSLLEASLLLRYALAKRMPVDPDVIKRVKHARAYL